MAKSTRQRKVATPAAIVQPDEVKIELPVVVTEAAKVVRPTCSACHHYLQVAGEQYGHCRRYPPATIVGRGAQHLTNDGPLGIFPITLSTSLCGEYAEYASNA